MVEHRPWLTFLTHVILILGGLVIAFPIYTTFVASTHSLDDITSYFPLLPGRHLIENYHQALTVGSGEVIATFLFRQFFMTIPDELCEVVRIDGGGPIRFFFDILLPMSRTSIAAMFVIPFIYGWNQYLWPLMITTDEKYYTLLIGIKRMLDVGEGQADWHIIMASTMLAMIPPVAVVIFMQKQFVKGMTETEK